MKSNVPRYLVPGFSIAGVISELNPPAIRRCDLNEVVVAVPCEGHGKPPLRSGHPNERELPWSRSHPRCQDRYTVPSFLVSTQWPPVSWIVAP